MESKSMYILYCLHSQFIGVRGNLTDIICSAVNNITSGQAIGAQKIRALWVIAVRSNDARETLLQTGIMVNDMRIELHVNNPLAVQKVQGERVLIKDFPLWEDDSLLKDFFTSHPNIGEFSKIYRSSSKFLKFENGDRFAFMKLNPNAHPPISPRIQVAGHSCRVQYPNLNRVCERCQSISHKTNDIEICEAYIPEQPDVHFFTGGILSNFNMCSVQFEEIDFTSSEQAYQWSACVEKLREDLAEEVMKANSPSEAKRIASAVKTVDSNWHNVKYGVMEKVLHAKANCSKDFRESLLATGEKQLIEARADLWWGSGMPYNLTTTTKSAFHPGKSWLGEILMKLRSQLRTQNNTKHEEQTTAPPTGPKEKHMDPASSTENAHKNLRSSINRRGRNSSSSGSNIRSTCPSENRIRSSSVSPARSHSLKGVKFDTPLLKDFLRKQAKQTRNQPEPKDKNLQMEISSDRIDSDDTHL